MIVYKIKNKLDGKIYIGQTTKTLERRWYAHCRAESDCRYLKAAIKTHGKDNFEIKIVAHCSSPDEMNHRETYYIKLFKSLAPNGYNLTVGGERSEWSEVSRNKSSETHKKLATEGKNSGCFKKGQYVPSRHVKRPGWVNSTAFKKGNKPAPKSNPHTKQSSRPGWTNTTSFGKGSTPGNKGKKLIVVDGKKKYV